MHNWFLSFKFGNTHKKALLALQECSKHINENGNADSEFILLYCADGKNNSKHDEQGPQSSPVTM